jgi:hypothetical protein
MDTDRETGKGMNRRAFLRNAGAFTAASCLPVSLVELAFADESKSFRFLHLRLAHRRSRRGGSFATGIAA